MTQWVDLELYNAAHTHGDDKDMSWMSQSFPLRRVIAPDSTTVALASMVGRSTSQLCWELEITYSCEHPECSNYAVIELNMSLIMSWFHNYPYTYTPSLQAVQLPSMPRLMLEWVLHRRWCSKGRRSLWIFQRRGLC